MWGRVNLPVMLYGVHQRAITAHRDTSLALCQEARLFDLFRIEACKRGLKLLIVEFVSTAIGRENTRQCDQFACQGENRAADYHREREQIVGPDLKIETRGQIGEDWHNRLIVIRHSDEETGTHNQSADPNDGFPNVFLYREPLMAAITYRHLIGGCFLRCAQTAGQKDFYD